MGLVVRTPSLFGGVKKLILRLSSSDMRLYARKIRVGGGYAFPYLQIVRAPLARNKVHGSTEILSQAAEKMRKPLHFCNL
jgi:hypothetical protein